ncbi:MAG TPA: hypothetical protein VKS21_05310 [Spirochaetota bacterium]|nr:hypothetical protein [Spirochaetota bacterium]
MKNYALKIIFSFLTGLACLWGQTGTAAEKDTNDSRIKSGRTLPDWFDRARLDADLYRYYKTVNRLKYGNPFRISVIGRFSAVNYQLQKFPASNIKGEKSYTYWDNPPYEPNLKIEMETPKLNNLSLAFTYGMNMAFDDSAASRFKVIHNYCFHLGLNLGSTAVYLAIGGPRFEGQTMFSFSSPGGGWGKYPFERDAWDLLDESPQKYKELTAVSDIDKDDRAGGQGIKGIYTEMWNLPGKLHLAAFWGKSDKGEIFWETASSLIYYIVDRKFKHFKAGLGGKHYLINLSNTWENDRNYHNLTAFSEFNLKNDSHFFLEYGHSFAQSAQFPAFNGSALYGEFQQDMEKVAFFDKLRLSSSGFVVSPRFTGPATAVHHTYNYSNYTPVQAVPGSGIAVNLMQSEEYINTAMGVRAGTHLYNNRYGFKGEMQADFKALTMGLRYNFSRTIKKTAARVTFSHNLNHNIWYDFFGVWEPSLNLEHRGDGSDFDLNRYGWKDVTETVSFTNTDPHRHSFDNLRLLLGIDLAVLLPFLQESYFYGFYIQKNMWQQKKISMVLADQYKSLFAGDLAYLFWAQKLFKNFYLLLFGGAERWFSDDTVIPYTLKDKSAGAGFDFRFTPYSSLFLRVRGYSIKRKYTDIPENRGIVSSLEMKVIF